MEILLNPAIDVKTIVARIGAAAFIVLPIVTYFLSLYSPKNIKWWCTLISSASLVQAGTFSLLRENHHNHHQRQHEIAIAELEQKVIALESSIALGLADAYFLNFLKWVAKDISRNSSNVEETISRIKLTKLDTSTTFQPQTAGFYILVPSIIDNWDAADPFRALLQKYKDENLLTNVHVGQANKDNPRFRPQIISWAPSVTCSGVAGVVIDIPTTLQVIYQNIKDMDIGMGSGSGDDIMGIKQEAYKREVHLFVSRLSWRLKKEGLDPFVTVVEITNSFDVLNTFDGAI